MRRLGLIMILTMIAILWCQCITVTAAEKGTSDTTILSEYSLVAHTKASSRLLSLSKMEDAKYSIGLHNSILYGASVENRMNDCHYSGFFNKLTNMKDKITNSSIINYYEQQESQTRFSLTDIILAGLIIGGGSALVAVVDEDPSTTAGGYFIFGFLVGSIGSAVYQLKG